MTALPASADALFSMQARAWESVDDGVMGGRSAGTMVAAGDHLRFAGTISLANGGGFASVRRSLEGDLSGASALRLTVRGDGRRYQVRLRADADPRSVAWRFVFTTHDRWQTLELPLDGFDPVFRGRSVSDAEPLQPGSMRLIGFMTADKQPGPFRLDVAGCTALKSSA